MHGTYYSLPSNDAPTITNLHNLKLNNQRKNRRSVGTFRVAENGRHRITTAVTQNRPAVADAAMMWCVGYECCCLLHFLDRRIRERGCMSGVGYNRRRMQSPGLYLRPITRRDNVDENNFFVNARKHEQNESTENMRHRVLVVARHTAVVTRNSSQGCRNVGQQYTSRRQGESSEKILEHEMYVRNKQTDQERDAVIMHTHTRIYI